MHLTNNCMHAPDTVDFIGGRSRYYDTRKLFRVALRRGTYHSTLKEFIGGRCGLGVVGLCANGHNYKPFGKDELAKYMRTKDKSKSLKEFNNLDPILQHHWHMSQKGPSSLTQFTIKIENSNTSKYSTAVAKKEREGKENNACL